MDRDSLQGTAAHVLAKETRLLCQWATGTGKSGVALRFLESNPDMDCLILVPEQNNISNWEFEFRKFNVPLDKVKIACYASFKKFIDTKWDLIVFDEVPHIDTELRRKVCESVKGEFILALGAVVDDEEKASLEEAYGTFYVSTITLSDAIDGGLLPRPTICVIHMVLDDTKKSYIVNGIRCTALQKYNHIVSKINAANELYDKHPNKYNDQMRLRLGNERKRFLGQLKDNAVLYLCDKLKKNNKRFLCFCSSIKQAKSLGGNYSFTSETPKSMDTLNKFNNHEIDSLFVVSKLIEGQNLVDIDSGIITQLGGTPRITVQMIGRIMRSKKPIIYVPIFDDTKDTSFLWTVTSNVPADCIKHYKLNSIT